MRGKVDAWSYPWVYTCWRLGALTAISGFNQTHNLGFGAEATHTLGDPPKYITTSLVRSLTFPLTHPKTVCRDAQADAAIDSNVFGISVVGAIQRTMKTGMRRTLSVATRALRKATTR